MSKSIGNVVDPVKLSSSFGVDGVRLYFLAEGPQDFDANFDETELAKTYNLFIEGFSTFFFLVIYFISMKEWINE